MKRAVGYCLDTECEDYARGMFLLNHIGTFTCPTCKKKGLMISEQGSSEGKSKLWKEVRVEFSYDPLLLQYRSIAIVRDDSLKGIHNVYTLFSPLIRTEKRALKVAEGILASLQGNPYIDTDSDGGFIPRATENVLKFDEPFDKIKRDLDILSKGWEGLKARE